MNRRDLFKVGAVAAVSLLLPKTSEASAGEWQHYSDHSFNGTYRVVEAEYQPYGNNFHDANIIYHYINGKLDKITFISPERLYINRFENEIVLAKCYEFIKDDWSANIVLNKLQFESLGVSRTDVYEYRSTWKVLDSQVTNWKSGTYIDL